MTICDEKCVDKIFRKIVRLVLSENLDGLPDRRLFRIILRRFPKNVSTTLYEQFSPAPISTLPLNN